MSAESRAAFSFLFFVVTTLISITAISSHGQGRQSEFSDSVISQNFNGYINKIFNKDIIPELQRVSYQYLMMATYFGRSDVALPGFAEYFRSASDRELANVNFVMSYINKRGGYIDCRDIERPETFKWLDGIDALEDALVMERKLNKAFLDLHRKASNKGDTHLKHSLEDQFLDQKVRLIKELGDHLTVLEGMRGGNYGLGEYTFDKSL